MQYVKHFRMKDQEAVKITFNDKIMEQNEQNSAEDSECPLIETPKTPSEMDEELAEDSERTRKYLSEF